MHNAYTYSSAHFFVSSFYSLFYFSVTIFFRFVHLILVLSVPCYPVNNTATPYQLNHKIRTHQKKKISHHLSTIISIGLVWQFAIFLHVFCSTAVAAIVFVFVIDVNVLCTAVFSFLSLLLCMCLMQSNEYHEAEALNNYCNRKIMKFIDQCPSFTGK